MQLFQMTNEVMPLSSIGWMMLIWDIVRIFQIRITPLVSLDINRWAFDIRLVMPNWWPEWSFRTNVLLRCGAIVVSILPEMVSLRKILFPFCGMMKMRISPWLLPREDRGERLFASYARSVAYRHRVGFDQCLRSLANRSMLLEGNQCFPCPGATRSTCSICLILVQRMHVEITGSIWFIDLRMDNVFHRKVSFHRYHLYTFRTSQYQEIANG